MRLFRFLFASIGMVACAGNVLAVDPITIELRDQATVGTSLVTLGQIALISGGDEAARARIGRIDVADLKSRTPDANIGRRSVEYRLILAGFDSRAIRVTGSDHSAVTLARRSVSVEEVTAAAKAELLRHITSGPDTITVELAFPVVVKLPQLPRDEQPVITVKPHGRVVTPGRVQMDLMISSSTEQLLSLAVHLEVKSARQTGGLVTPVGGMGTPTSTEVLIRPRQRVTMEVRRDGLIVKAIGEAQQQGRLGENILVQNVDSKKSIVARVTGPSTVEVDIGGTP